MILTNEQSNRVWQMGGESAKLLLDFE